MVNTYRVVYDYCNLGGVTSVFKHRISVLRQRGFDGRFHFIFRQDLGGRAGLVAFDGVEVEICDVSDFHSRAAAIINASPDPVILVDQPEILRRVDTTGRRVLYEVHTSLEQTFRRMRPVDFSGVERIVCVSQWLKRKLHEVLPAVPRDRISVVNNFVDPMAFRRTAAPAGRRFTAPPILWVGKISADKNWEDGLDVLRLLRGRAEFAPVMVTGGAAEPAATMAFLHRVATLGLLERLLWIHNLPHADVAGLFNAVAAAGGVMLSTSKFESFGLAALEAMSCGVPVVAAGVGGLSEIFEGVEDCLFELGDNQRAAEMIVGLLADRERHALVSARVSRRAAWFDRERIMSDYARLLGEPEPNVPKAVSVRGNRRPGGAAVGTKRPARAAPRHPAEPAPGTRKAARLAGRGQDR
jgi:glycosyltransferase involved in cell wall biosynthesis